MARIITLTAVIMASFISILNAEYRLNFFIGDVRVETNGKAIELRQGMIIPTTAVIITGKRSQAHLYDTAHNTVVSIQAGEKISIASLSGLKKTTPPSAWHWLRKENRSANLTFPAAVRGAEEGKVELEWDDGCGSSEIASNRDYEWKLFNEKQYSKIIPMTKNATDTEGIFLHAAATYYLKGNSSAKNVAPVLENLITGGAGSNIKTESRKILSAITFDQARFDLSWEHMSAVAKNIPECEISESGYYILTQSAFYTNRSDKGREYLRKMKKCHSRSQLIEKIITR